MRRGQAGRTIAGDIHWGPHHYDFVGWVLDPDPAAPVEIEFEEGKVHYHYPGGVVVHSYPFPGDETLRSSKDPMERCEVCRQLLAVGTPPAFPSWPWSWKKSPWGRDRSISGPANFRSGGAGE